MRKFALWTTIMAISYTTFCQGLKPRVLIEGKDTSFNFTIPQTRFIAKTIVAKEYGDSINFINSQVIHAQDSIIKNYSQRVMILRTMADNYDAQIRNLNVLNATLKLNLNDAQSKVVKLKKRRWLYFGAGILTSAITVHLLNR